MRKRLTTLLFVGVTAAASSAVAEPDQKPSDNSTSDDVHVTVTAGRGRLGVAVIQISPELRAHFGGPKDRGVLVDSVKPDSPAARAGVRVGDVVLEVDGEVTRSAGDMIDAMADRNKGEQVTVEVLRAGKRVPLTATLESDPGPRWQSFGGLGGFGGGIDSDFDGMFKRFEWQMPRLRGNDMQRELDEARRKLEELQRRLDKMPPGKRT